MLKEIASAACVAASALAPCAFAQDIALQPTYGSVQLAPGFDPDPHVVRLKAGGGEDARQISPECLGWVSDAPDLRLTYGSGGERLFISAASQADTTLVINLPDGGWFCDDDGGLEGLNPGFMAFAPAAGIYDIWVGSIDSTTTPDAELHISETGSQ